MTASDRHKAYHDLQLPDGTIIHGPVTVVVDADDNLVSWHPLNAEEPFTEWIGGCFIVQKDEKTTL